MNNKHAPYLRPRFRDLEAKKGHITQVHGARIERDEGDYGLFEFD